MWFMAMTGKKEKKNSISGYLNQKMENQINWAEYTKDISSTIIKKKILILVQHQILGNQSYRDYLKQKNC